MTTAVIYCRCSTEEESQVDALGKQVLEAESSVEENGWHLVDRYVELKSGTTSKGREQYCRLFEDMLTLKFDIIVIKSQDRLMRNVKDWYLFLDRMQKQGKRLYLYLERKFYTTEDALITGIKAILAEEYSRELSRKIGNAHRHRQKNGGRVMLTNQVYGFRKEPDGSVSLVEDEARTIREIYQYSAEGYGSRVIANILHEKGIRSKNDCVMSAAAVRRIIRNPLYKGIFVMNRQHFDFDTKHLIHNPPEQWIYQTGLVPAIVEEGLWERANAAMDRRVRRKLPSGESSKGSVPIPITESCSGKYMLSGKIICGICGRTYYRTWRRSCSDPEKVIVEWKCGAYIERGRTGEAGCDNVHLNEKIVQELLEELNASYFSLGQREKEEIIQEAIQILEQALNSNGFEKELTELKEKEQAVSQRKEVLLDKLLAGVISDGDYQERRQRMEDELGKIREKRGQLEYEIREQKGIEQRLKEIRERLENGGVEKAATGKLLMDIRYIIVHEWQLEIQFDPLRIAGVQTGGPYDSAGFSIFLDYPFPPSTEKGRILDRLRIMECLKEDPGLTAKKLAERLGRTKGIIRSRIVELTRDGYLRFEGKGSHGYWKIVNELPFERIL